MDITVDNVYIEYSATNQKVDVQLEGVDTQAVLESSDMNDEVIKAYCQETFSTEELLDHMDTTEIKQFAESL